MLNRIQCWRAASAICILACFTGCTTDDDGEGTDDPVLGDWFAYFRLTLDDEAHLYIRQDWNYALVPDASGSTDNGNLPSEHRTTIETLFANGLENYESDSMSTSGADMDECDATVAHPIVHRILINPDPLVGEPGFGCWSTDEDLSEDTRMMIERMEGILHSLSDADDGSDDDAGM